MLFFLKYFFTPFEIILPKGREAMNLLRQWDSIWEENSTFVLVKFKSIALWLKHLLILL